MSHLKLTNQSAIWFHSVEDVGERRKVFFSEMGTKLTGTGRARPLNSSKFIFVVVFFIYLDC